MDVEMVKSTLEAEGLDFTLHHIKSKNDFLKSIHDSDYDIVLADYSIPGFDGLSALNLAQSIKPESPFIIISGTIGEETAIDVIKQGATDYVLKQRLSRLVPAIVRALSEAKEKVERKKAQKELRLSHDKLHKALVQTVNSLALAVETRDPYVSGHQQRVAQLASEIATALSLGEEAVEGIFLAGNLHDIGKINIPSGILSKPGILNDLEIALIKNHSQVGYDILKGIDFPWPIALTVYQHHEKLDGSGYPLGIKGDEMLFEARIIGVADVVEAMSSHRPYRPARGVKHALEEISDNAGLLYDREVVDCCLDLFQNKGFTFTYQEEHKHFF